ncbi:signal recognition particle-docking protein FtsY [Oscillatoria sp. CS-180]|uniref:signal recognition particle-docking protein FtsY n=1 Tax=Oscillatoria sp. CS-180 TaxID=3021720 RepID=UPI00232CD2BF|nr:signal recognition particle-docking protein FtsY [Oscillatoria sp. CS-180]MDB9528768.1 signal recognition particle-docking protein FtsY [Oscillatoria sp. CS-180]
MTNFNWFSRKFDQSSGVEEPEKTTDKASSQEAEQTAQSSDAATTASPEDYLAWAKAAYQNIQSQQTAVVPETAPSPEAEEETEESEASAATDSSEIVEPTSETASSQAGDEETLSESPEAEPEAVASESGETSPAIAETVASDLETESTEAATPAVASSGPAWMQSTADRQARLERLQETAIAEPEPEPEPATATVSEPVLPDIDFDEAFLWSAEVLAGQGRQATDISIEEITWLNRLRRGLDKTRRGLVNQLKAIVGQGPLNEDAVFEIEALLLQADVGVEATDAIIEALQARLREETLPPEQAIAYLKTILRDMLDKPLGETHNLEFVPEKESFNIWLLTGVNGAGKTTTIGKLAHIAKKSGYSCLIGAADTFRAAAVEQVKAWGARSNVDVIANPGKNTDPAAVVFDAITAAQSRNCELLLVDTAGRLQNKKNLMEELAKIRRIIGKKAPDAHVESLLVLDATLGQNGLRQAQVFAEAADLSGVVLTKLDGTARGGVALAVVQQLNLPIRFIGAGEGIEDLRPFSSYEFVEALLSG